MNESSQTEILRISDPELIDTVCGILAEYGIKANCVVVDDPPANASEPATTNHQSLSIQVNQEDVEDALTVLESLQEGNIPNALDAAEDEHEDDDEAWPVCPNCRESRQTQCPGCGYHGYDFETATLYSLAIEEQNSQSHGSSLEPVAQPIEAQKQITGSNTDNSLPGEPVKALVCPVCSQQFKFRLINFCTFCGNEFADGVRLETSDETRVVTENHSGLIIMVMGVILVVVLGILYFVLL
ncbi:MAG TPA: hypothetical protein PKD64_13050 [Pirellulaceae bacterium]|nr:hypothetical protein [Pirellulaceae bacterium]HMO93114.1 hypothetical protein [Pirellulaceae bacterium]HMP70327.1 hypothetical protein [Pirellulaceae bacterium]